MIQAIFYKEWIKTRWYWLLATLFMIGITGYSMLRIGRTIAIQGIDHLWVVMVQKDAIFIDLLQFVPLLIGILLAAVQFFPEMQRKCLIIAALIFRVYFLAPGAEAYNSFLPCLTLYTLLAASLSWISVVRFKAGKQD